MNQKPIELERRNGVQVAKHSDDTGPLELAQHTDLERVDTNEGKETRRVHKTTDTLDRMLRTVPPRITQGQYDAGRKFQRLFYIAGHSRSDAPGWLRLAASAQGSDGPENMADAKNAIHAAIQALGGQVSLGGSVMWHVVGCGLTLGDFAMQRHNNEQRASGALESGLAVLQAHWGM